MLSMRRTKSLEMRESYLDVRTCAFRPRGIATEMNNAPPKNNPKFYFPP
jgi:hypothetical protein